MFRKLPLFTLVLVGTFSLPVVSIVAQELSTDEFHSTMDPYVGIWKGEYRIYSQRDELLNQFKVNRNYWWEGHVLMGRISYNFGQMNQTYFHRIILSEGLPYSFVTESAGSEDIKSALKGEFLKGTIVWSRILPKGSLPVRISERIVNSDEGQFIEFWGNQEAKDAKGDSLLVRIEGFAAYVPDSRKFVVASKPTSAQSQSSSISETIKTVEQEREVETTEVIDEDERDRRLRTLSPNRRSASRASRDLQEVETEVETATAEEETTEEKEPKASVDELIDIPEVVDIPETVEELPVEVSDTEAESKSSSKASEPNPELQNVINSLNIVGINDNEGEECIVVDFFLLYEVGDRLDTEDVCVFVGLDEQYLYFEDADGYRYQLFRKDVLSE